jgi:hypothetical protein
MDSVDKDIPGREVRYHSLKIHEVTNLSDVGEPIVLIKMLQGG